MSNKSRRHLYNAISAITECRKKGTGKKGTKKWARKIKGTGKKGTSEKLGKKSALQKKTDIM